jgi:hypothetical protein
MNWRLCNIGGMRLTGKTKPVGENPVPEPLCPSYLSWTAPVLTDGSYAVRRRWLPLEPRHGHRMRYRNHFWTISSVTTHVHETPTFDGWGRGVRSSRGGSNIEWRDNVMIGGKLRNSETNMLCCLWKLSRPFLGSTQPHMLSILRPVCPGCEYDRSPSSYADVKNGWR